MTYRSKFTCTVHLHEKRCFMFRVSCFSAFSPHADPSSLIQQFFKRESARDATSTPTSTPDPRSS